MKSIISSLGIVIVVLVLFAFDNIKEIIDRHFFSIICLVGAIIALIAYIKTPTDDDSNTPLPPDTFHG
jgi:hypothetical protein